MRLLQSKALRRDMLDRVALGKSRASVRNQGRSPSLRGHGVGWGRDGLLLGILANIYLVRVDRRPRAEGRRSQCALGLAVMGRLSGMGVDNGIGVNEGA